MMNQDEHKVREAVERVLRYKSDYELFARDCLKIRSKSGGLVPFVFNRAQRNLWNSVKKKLESEEMVRMYLLKARQLGVSTWAEGLVFWKMLHNPQSDALVVAHDTDSASKILSMLHLMWQELPPDIRPTRRIANRREIWLANPRYPDDGSNDPGIQSRALIATADNRNFGIGSTIQYAHLSEFSRYPAVNAHIQETMKTFRQAVPRLPGTVVVYETTARGYNYARDVWNDDNNGIEKIFLSWIADETYSSEYPLDPSDIHNGSSLRYGDESVLVPMILSELEMWYPENADSPDWLRHEVLKRLAWRRQQLDEEFDGDLDVFRQEHPIRPEEAFRTTGRSVFNVALLQDRIEEDRKFRHSSKYTFDRSTGKFVQSMRFWDLEVFAKPEHNCRYVIGADVAEGYSDGDYSAAQILSIPDLEQVAVVRSQIDADEYAELLASIGALFGNAYIAVEVTGPGLATQVKLNSLRYPFMYARKVLDSRNSKSQNKWGWSTNRVTKPLMISDLRSAIRSGDLILHHDQTVSELCTYTEDVNGKLGASPGEHDDLVMSLAIAYQMALQYGLRGLKNQRPASEVEGTLSWWEDRLMPDREQKFYRESSRWL